MSGGILSIEMRSRASCGEVNAIHFTDGSAERIADRKKSMSSASSSIIVISFATQFILGSNLVADLIAVQCFTSWAEIFSDDCHHRFNPPTFQLPPISIP